MNTKTKTMYRILFICAGNICRSPMAEAALRAKVPKSLAKDIEVLSAGLNTFTGLSASVEAELACRLKEYDLSGHRSKQASEVLLDTCHLVLCMEPAQTRYLHEKYPQMISKIHTFRHFCSGEDEPIEDPYNQDVQVYIKTLNKLIAELNKCKTRLWDMVREWKKSR